MDNPALVTRVAAMKVEHQFEKYELEMKMTYLKQCFDDQTQWIKNNMASAVSELAM